MLQLRSTLAVGPHPPLHALSEEAKNSVLVTGS
jgi:hypothetical protein